MSLARKNLTHQLLTFILCNEVFALGIDTVREVLDGVEITQVPQSPAHLCGVINLRGSVVPVLEMRKKFGLSDRTANEQICIIILEVKFDDEHSLVGVIADSVCEVITLEENEINPAPRIGTALNTDFIRGMGKHNDKFITLLDIDRTFSNTPASEQPAPTNNGGQGEAYVA